MPPRVEFKHISKSFPGVKALTDISLTLEPGEVHVLVGENGAGKSTLMKILSGAYTADEGELWIEGKQVEKNSPTVASDLGIGMIYQELNLIPELSIARNIFMCNEIKGKLKVFNSSRAMNAEARRLMREINLEEEPTTLVKISASAPSNWWRLLRQFPNNARSLYLTNRPALLRRRRSKSSLR